ncbi:MAG TPA: hypothetical protein VF613_00365 [Longimicrobium sp.]
MSTPHASRRLVLDSRMSCTSWIPANPDACARLLPPALKPAENHAVYMNQYVVAEQTAGPGGYSVTCLGLDVAGHFARDGATPARFITHHLNSSERVRTQVRERGIPAATGCTTVEVRDGVMTATTYDGATAIIRTRASVGNAPRTIAAGHLRYLARMEAGLVSGHHPYVGELAVPYEVLSIEFLEPGHPVYALRPAAPLELVPASCFYAPLACTGEDSGSSLAVTISV